MVPSPISSSWLFETCSVSSADYREAHLDEKLGDLVVDLHVAENSGTIIGDVDVSIGRDEDLVKTSRAERRLDDVGDSAGGKNVALCVSAYDARSTKL